MTCITLSEHVFDNTSRENDALNVILDCDVCESCVIGVVLIRELEFASVFVVVCRWPSLP